jgi:hypothetical protein
LASTRFDGSPEAAYNEKLEELDMSLVTYFKASRLGQIVLVETFGGKRHYYYYVDASADLEAVLQELRSRFPGYKLETQTRNDPRCGFIRRYTAEFFTNTKAVDVRR